MMKTLEVKKIRRYGRVEIEPVRDFIIFKHCSGGAIAVTEDVFEKEVQPLLFVHGIEQVMIK